MVSVTVTEAFNRLYKLLVINAKVAAVRLTVLAGKLYVSGIARGNSFHFEVELKDENVADFNAIVSVEDLVSILKMSIKSVCYENDVVKFKGSLGNSESSPILDLLCPTVATALANDVSNIDIKTKESVDALVVEDKVCDVKDVLKPWQSLAKCGNRLFITPDLIYSTSPATNAFYKKDSMCANLPKTDEPLQVESTFILEMATLKQVFSEVDLRLYTLKSGTVFIVASDDGSVYMVAGAPIRIEKNTLGRMKRRYADAIKFDEISLPQNALKDVLQVAADTADVNFCADESSYLAIDAGVSGHLLVDTTDFDCNCEGTREHAVIALNALPSESYISLGYGESEGRNFLSFQAAGVIIIVSVQDRTEV